MERDQRQNAGTVIVIGLALGVFTSIFAFVVAGGGHGLVSAIFSFSSLVLAPAAFVSILGRRRMAMLIIAVIGIVLDAEMWREAMDERIMAKLWNAIPAAVAIWIICWLSWQLVLLAAFLRKAPNE
ncbi:MAG: hypothetical protein QOE82_2455 [Thermoanaerobaculia bacterium]|jgi:hypothetical protein|nr:hypothetical protein [Thermoanaerobaculia bacterium]